MEFIFQFLAEFIFQGVIIGIGQGLKLIGILVLKLLTLSHESIGEMKVKYDDSIMPFFIGLGTVIGFICLVFNFL